MIRETIDQFVKLQGLDTRIHHVDEQLMKIPALLKESKEAYEVLLHEKDEAAAELVSQKTVLNQEEAQLAQQKDLLANAQKKLTSVQNNKEYEAALKELDTLKKHIADGEQKVVVIKTRVGELEAVIKEKSELAQEKEQEYISQKSEKETENKELFDEAAVLKAERASFAATIKKSLLSKYEKIRAARHNVAIAPIHGETCTGCYMKIPPQMAVEVKKERELLQCPYCQRFMYHDKDAEHAEDAHAEAS